MSPSLSICFTGRERAGAESLREETKAVFAPAGLVVSPALLVGVVDDGGELVECRSLGAATVGVGGGVGITAAAVDIDRACLERAFAFDPSSSTTLLSFPFTDNERPRDVASLNLRLIDALSLTVRVTLTNVLSVDGASLSSLLVFVDVSKFPARCNIRLGAELSVDINTVSILWARGYYGWVT